MIRLRFVAFAVLASLSIGLVHAQDSGVPRFEPSVPCLVEALARSDSVECGRVIVPEEHAVSNGRTLSLGIVRYLKTTEGPGAPIFFAAGGPGGSAMDTASLLPLLFPALDTFLESHEIVFFDQRGTEYAEPTLDCPEVAQKQRDAIIDGVAVSARRDVLTAAFAVCRDRLLSQGVNFNAYDSVENAADVNAIAQALGYDSIILYGQSYGTILAQHVMRDFPQLLEAVILDGAVPLDMRSWSEDTARKMDDTLTQIFALCASDPACDAAFPDPAAQLNAVFDSLAEQPVEVVAENIFDPSASFTAVMDSELAASALNFALYSPQSAARIPNALYSFTAGRYDLFSEMIPLAVDESGVAIMMHFATVCAEDPVSAQESPPIDSALEAVRVEAEADADSYVTVCALLNVDPLPDTTDINVQSDLPVLFLNGALDPATPPWRSDQVAATLPNSFSFLFPYGSHIQLFRNACANAIFMQFVTDPTTRPDGTCIESLHPLNFELPE